MKMNINVKYKFKVNGKEYGSLEEMPADIREAYEKTVGKPRGFEHGNISSMKLQKIVFNGQVYESVSSMPIEIRPMYEAIMKSVENGEIPAPGNISGSSGSIMAGIKNESALTSADLPKPITPNSAFSAKVLIAAAAIIVLLAGIYYLLALSGSR